MGEVYTARNDPRASRWEAGPYVAPQPITDEQRQAEARRSARAARWHALSVEIALAAIHAERRGRLRSGYPLT